MISDNQAKDEWCRHGEVLENEFIARYGELLQLQINPEKATNKYAPDLTHPCGIADLKTQATPFRTAGRYGIPTERAVTFNRKDAVRYYQNYPEIHLYFWVRFLNPSVIYTIGFDELVPILKDAPTHTYQQRKGDTSGNARESFVLDTNQLIFLMEAT